MVTKTTLTKTGTSTFSSTSSYSVTCHKPIPTPQPTPALSGSSQGGGNGGNGNLNSCPVITAPVAASSSANSCGVVEANCMSVCGSAATAPGMSRPLGKADVVNGVGTYDCQCCSGGRVEGGLASDAAAEKVAVDKVPWSVWLTIAVFGFIMWVLRRLTKPPGAAAMTNHTTAAVVAEAKAKGTEKVMEKVAGALSEELDVDTEAGMMCSCCKVLVSAKEKMSEKMAGVAHPEILLLEAGAPTRLGPNYPIKFKAGNYMAYACNTHPALRVLFGDRKLLQKRMCVSKLFFGLCLSFALALAFGGAQFNSKQFVSCARNCYWTQNGGSSQKGCSTIQVKKVEQGLGGSIKPDPVVGSITTIISQVFSPMVDGLLKNGMPRESAAPTHFLARNVSRIVNFAGVVWLVLGIVFMVTLSEGSSADNSRKLFVVGSILISNIIIDWFFYLPLKAFGLHYLAKKIKSGSGSGGAGGAGGAGTDGDVELQRTTSSSDVNDTVTNPMAAKEGDDSEQNPTAQL
jgi:hypothetical protein